MTPARRWAPSVAWVAVILIATSLPGSSLPRDPGIPGFDKLVHGFLYGVLGALVMRAVIDYRVATRVWIGAAIVVFAAVDEVHQQWIPGRGADVRDWMADVAGAATGALLMYAAMTRRETST